ARILPRPVQEQLDIWIATGGTPESTVRAAVLGKPVMYAMLGGAINSFSQHQQLYRRTAVEHGHDSEGLKVGVSSVGLIQRHNAHETYYPYWMDSMSRISAERGFPAPDRQSYDMQASARGALFVGNAEQITEKILRLHEFMDHDRQIFQLDFSSIPQQQVLESIELLGTEILPAVNKELGQ
ncbi:MAG TPA: LLM class flavin-dependent oxidoreductase, partial [Arthrobacter sp.]|nr:LLM class flavin-dependent oxidoreductase [Arthrobacter sp.]